MTAGSVDDGKSTLIGRLLHDASLAAEDQIAAAQRATTRRGGQGVDLSLLLDGLLAEREQGITIDVAHRYFSTPRRRFILADAPGHEEYTRNMASAASRSDLAVILVDAAKGIRAQTRRHAFIASLMGVRHMLVAVNKMDLVGFDEARFQALVDEFAGFAARLDTVDLHFIPLSALHGDNVVTPSPRTPWFHGGTLLDYLETVHVASDRNLVDLRFPIQHVVRARGARWYGGTVASGILRPGEELVVLPSGERVRVARLHLFERELSEAFPPMAVTLTLDREVDLARGHLLVRPRNQPIRADRAQAMVVWMGERPARAGDRFVALHLTRQVRCRVEAIVYRMDVTTLRREAADALGPNDIGRLEFSFAGDLLYDPYAVNRATGAFVLVDELTDHTVAGGMFIAREGEAGHPSHGPGAVPGVVWIVGGAAARKVAAALARRLDGLGVEATILDRARLAKGLNRDLPGTGGHEAVRRMMHVAGLIAHAGVTVVLADPDPPPDSEAPGGRWIVVGEQDMASIPDPLGHLLGRLGLTGPGGGR